MDVSFLTRRLLYTLLWYSVVEGYSVLFQKNPLPVSPELLHNYSIVTKYTVP
jgi:hypothetical protein